MLLIDRARDAIAGEMRAGEEPPTPREGGVIAHLNNVLNYSSFVYGRFSRSHATVCCADGNGRRAVVRSGNGRQRKTRSPPTTGFSLPREREGC